MHDARRGECTPYLIAFHHQSSNAAKEAIYISYPFYSTASIVRVIEDTPAVSEVISEVSDETCALVKGALGSKAQAAHEIRDVSNAFQNCRKVSRIGRVGVRGRRVRNRHVRIRAEQPSQAMFKRENPSEQVQGDRWPSQVMTSDDAIEFRSL